MPLDAPPPLMDTPPPPDQPPSAVAGLGGLAGMGTQGQSLAGLIRMASEFVLKAAQVSQQNGDQASTAQLAQVMSQLTDIVAAQQQGMGAGPMASNAMGAPPPPGGPAAAQPLVGSPASQPPTPMMLPRSSMMGG
jgi:hypothetical protein